MPISTINPRPLCLRVLHDNTYVPQQPRTPSFLDVRRLAVAIFFSFIPQSERLLWLTFDFFLDKLVAYTP
jgi:hypothetical protein